MFFRGQMPEWLKGADCKSAGFGLRRFESFSVHHFIHLTWSSFRRAGVAQLARVSAFQAEGCGFETRLPLQIPQWNTKTAQAVGCSVVVVPV
jgi:hypothetical protein